LEFRILGPLEVVVGGVPVAVGGHKARGLLAFFLLHRGEVVSRERLVDELWGERPPRAVAAELRVYVAKLRKALHPDLLVTRGNGYVLVTRDEDVDAVRFEWAAREGGRLLAAGEPESAARVLADALALWRGPVLSDLPHEPWALPEARRLEELRLGALEERLEAELALGRHAAAVAELKRLVMEHPYRERLRAQLMLALYRCGRQADALKVYRQTAHALFEELGIEPGPDLRNLERSILAHDPSLRLARLSAGNLPAPPTRLVGRRRELAELTALLSTSETRLVTLTGPGGSGKTRLALELAAQLGREFHVPAFFVELAPLVEPQLVLHTFARTIGLEGEAHAPSVETLSTFLRHRRLLVVLDNFEHLLDAGPGVAELLAAVRGLTVLATSRAPLHLRGEWRYELGPLRRDDAVVLFVERARAVGCAVVPDAGVELLCERLDGMPLAIELAAARADVLRPAEILAGLSRRFDLLSKGPRDAPERQRTLRAAIDWSYQSLTENEQDAFDRLGVFAGGCTLDAAEHVCHADTGVLASMVDKCLLRYRNERYSMLEAIRAFALERLHERGLTDAVSRALAGYLLALVQEGTGRIRTSPPPRDLSARLAGEVDNLRAAVARAFAAQDGELSAQLATEARWFGLDGGLWLEQRRWLEKVLPAPKSTYTQAHVLLTAGNVGYLLGDFEKARGFLEECLPLWGELDDDRGWIRNLQMLGVVLLDGFGDYTHAAALFRQSLAFAERVSDRRASYLALHFLGENEIRLGHLRAASSLLTRAIALARRADDPHLSSILMGAGHVALAEREFARATDLYAEALEVSASWGQSKDSAGCLLAFAALAAVAGDVERAGRLVGALETVEQEARFPQVLAPDRPKYDELIQACAETAPEAFAAAREWGRTMSFQDAIAYARPTIAAT
jgi:predicted ATPase/DNA-binding SARP family transcriptional activator